jgi:hypothetical protein
MILPYIHENLRQSQTLLVTIQCRAGRDTVHLVTVVPVEVQRNSGQELLSDYQKQAVRSMIDVRADVVVSFFAIYIVLPLTSVPSNPPGCVPACSIKVRGSHGLLECMEQYVVSECKPGATLAVMGSVELTSNVFESAVVSLFHLLSHGRASRALVMWLDFPPSIWSNPHLLSPFSSPRCPPQLNPWFTL